MKVKIIILFIFAVIFCLPIFLNSNSTFPRLDSDYDAVLPIYQYIGSYIRHNHTLPQTIPFVAGGIPIFGDPASGILNPLFLLPLIFFTINVSIRITFFLVIFASGISMYLFLKKIKVSQFLQYWGSFLYMSSGIITACISAGHITEKFLSIPLIPLFLLVELSEKITFKEMLLLGIIISCSIYSGDLYGVWFFFIFFFCIEGFYFFSNHKKRLFRIFSFFGVIMTFLILSFPILYLLITHVYPIMRRPTLVNPFLGSIHAILLPLQFLLPFQVSFYDRPFFQKYVGFYYNWYEYYGFLGLFPVLFFKNIKQIWKNETVRMLIFLIFVGSLYLASKYVYSPFHWIFYSIRVIDVFRVPQRIVIPLTPVVIALFCLAANTWENKKTLYAICCISILWTIGVGWFTFSNTFVKPSLTMDKFIEKFSMIDTQHNQVINLIPFTQYFLIQKGIPIYNYYYAWVPTSTIPVVDSNDKVIKSAILKTKIMYILSKNSMLFNDIGFHRELEYKGFSVWKKN